MSEFKYIVETAMEGRDDNQPSADCGNCGDCEVYDKYETARNFVGWERVMAKANANRIASSQESYDSLMEYTQELLEGDMQMLFPGHEEFAAAVEEGACPGPKRNWRLLGLTKICQNPSLRDE